METAVVLFIVAAVLFTVATIAELVGDPRFGRVPLLPAGLLFLTLAFIAERT